MNLKLEELRKRLLDPTVSPAPSPTETIYKRSADQISPPESPVVTNGIDAAERRSTPLRETQLPTAPSDSLASTVLQYVGDNAADPARSRYQLAQAVTKVFESTRQHQERLADLAKSLDTIEQTAQSAARAFEPIRAFREQMEKLSSTFEPMRSFQEQLGNLAESFEPMKALHEQIAMLAEAFQINLAQFARSMEPAKAFQAQLAKLAKTFEAVGELQGQFLDLSETFRVASRGGVNSGAAVRN
jgi:DNA repair exonuclease SbcCD ATPase subunit